MSIKVKSSDGVLMSAEVIDQYGDRVVVQYTEGIMKGIKGTVPKTSVIGDIETETKGAEKAFSPDAGMLHFRVSGRVASPDATPRLRQLMTSWDMTNVKITPTNGGYEISGETEGSLGGQDIMNRVLDDLKSDFQALGFAATLNIQQIKGIKDADSATKESDVLNRLAKLNTTLQQLSREAHDMWGELREELVRLRQPSMILSAAAELSGQIDDALNASGSIIHSTRNAK